jgi:uncharacterized protein (UPF0303 family)
VTVTEPTDALIAEIEAQEARLRFSRFSNDDALRLGLLIVRLATERSLGITVDITRGEQQLVHIALDGSTADNDEWIARKTRVVRRFAASSLLVGLRQGDAFNARFDLPLALYAAHGGSFPIVVDGVGLVGTVTVSGLPQRDDHALVVEALEIFLSA